MYLSGIFKRLYGGAELELFLSVINEDHLNIIKSVKGILKKDNIDDLRALAKGLAKKLLE